MMVLRNDLGNRECRIYFVGATLMDLHLVVSGLVAGGATTSLHGCVYIH